MYGPVAQSVEHRSYEPRVAGSSPAGSKKIYFLRAGNRDYCSDSLF